MKTNLQWMMALAVGAGMAAGSAARAGESCCAAQSQKATAAAAECAAADASAAAVKEAAPEAAVKAQTLCPVMNRPIHPNLYVDAEGKRIYVCCKGCIAAVKADPAKYIAALEASGVTLATTPATATK